MKVERRPLPNGEGVSSLSVEANRSLSFEEAVGHILADLSDADQCVSQRRTSRRLAVGRLAEGRPSPVLKLPTFGLQNAINKPPNVTLHVVTHP